MKSVYGKFWCCPMSITLVLSEILVSQYHLGNKIIAFKSVGIYISLRQIYDNTLNFGEEDNIVI